MQVLKTQSFGGGGGSGGMHSRKNFEIIARNALKFKIVNANIATLFCMVFQLFCYPIRLTLVFAWCNNWEIK